MNKCEGEAAVNNRKGKLIFFYEWVMELKWKGILNLGSIVTGTFDVLNLSEEHEIEDVDVMINCDKSDVDSEQSKENLKNVGIKLVKQQLAIYLKCLKEEFSKGLILPTKDSSTLVQSKGKSDLLNPKAYTKPKVSESHKSCETGDLYTAESFKCRAEEFYRVLTTKEMVQAFTQGACNINASKGGKFELYGGNVVGYFTELIPNKLIQQKWRFKSWPEGLYSDVKIEINEKTDCTEVNIHQTGIPKLELENTKDGWKRYYWESIKRVFGFGVTLF